MGHFHHRGHGAHRDAQRGTRRGSCRLPACRNEFRPPDARHLPRGAFRSPGAARAAPPSSPEEEKYGARTVLTRSHKATKRRRQETPGLLCGPPWRASPPPAGELGVRNFLPTAPARRRAAKGRPGRDSVRESVVGWLRRGLPREQPNTSAGAVLLPICVHLCASVADHPIGANLRASAVTDSCRLPLCPSVCSVSSVVKSPVLAVSPVSPS
jgi:hypothetical protein